MGAVGVAKTAPVVTEGCEEGIQEEKIHPDVKSPTLVRIFVHHDGHQTVQEVEKDNSSSSLTLLGRLCRYRPLPPPRSNPEDKLKTWKTG